MSVLGDAQSVKTSRGSWLGFLVQTNLGLAHISCFVAGGRWDLPRPCLSFPICKAEITGAVQGKMTVKQPAWLTGWGPSPMTENGEGVKAPRNQEGKEDVSRASRQVGDHCTFV